MQRQRGELIRDASPQARHHFTRFDQVNLCFVSAREVDPDLGFMARLLALCSLPRLLMAWVCTEAVRTQSRELVLGRSLSEFMRTLGIYSTSGGTTGGRTRLRNQMKRLFGCSVSLIYEDEHGQATVSSLIARRTELWWNERKPDESALWESDLA